ncbi:MAG: methyltransferase domain-containing protein [Deltaproteobacteria bacterium]|nr:methyltransferase domain-containing protein [Deltaproteobacteria bacterium]
MNLEVAINKNRVRQAFSRQAPFYEGNARLQKEVAGKLVSLFPLQLRTPNSELRTLDIGIGTGFATKEFSSRFPKTSSFGCDIAWGMLKEAGMTGAVLAEADAEHLPYKDETFDLAFSSLAFQWTNLHNSVNEAFRILKPDGMFYFSTFGEKTLMELADSYSSAWRSIGIEGMPKMMRFESSKDVKTLMEFTGFKNVEVKTALIKSRYQSPDALLRSLKAIGAGNPSKEFQPSRTLLNNIFRIYKDRYGDNDGITATFEVIYAWGVKI